LIGGQRCGETSPRGRTAWFASHLNPEREEDEMPKRRQNKEEFKMNIAWKFCLVSISALSITAPVHAQNPKQGDYYTPINSVRSVAAELSERGILTPRGGAWHPTSAARLLSRLQAAS
jgi:hypothetical protein